MRQTKKYDFVFSLGEACSASYALRKANLQTYSLPFDWLYGSDFSSRIETLKDNFKNWLNIEDLELISTRIHPEPRNIYKNNRTNIVFSHDFPFGTNIEEYFSEIKDKYKRRISRLYKKINKSKKILVLYLLNPESGEKVSNEDLINGQKILSEIFKDKDIDILFLSHNGETSELTHNIRKIGYQENSNSEMKVSEKEIIKILKENIIIKQNLFERMNSIVRISKIKKGILLNLFPKVNTFFRISIYLLGLRFILCFGKERAHIQ